MGPKVPGIGVTGVRACTRAGVAAVHVRTSEPLFLGIVVGACGRRKAGRKRESGRCGIRGLEGRARVCERGVSFWAWLRSSRLGLANILLA